MNQLAASLMLLVATLASGSPALSDAIEEVALDMASSSFDDQYRGCGRWMQEELAELNDTEFSLNPLYAEAWTVATREWRSRRGHRALRPELAVAILAYTWDGALFRAFNAAVREAGSSRQRYLGSFHFKVLHFLLSEALRVLRRTPSYQLGYQRGYQRCYQVYRGVKGVRFSGRRDQLVRLGHFTSASLREESARGFGQDTLFRLESCYGVPVRDFSFFAAEEEVLVPPYEVFQVANASRRGAGVTIELRSAGAFSAYNCEWV
ncbi:NARE ribosyltransferase, partial [Upupa epops]|nr:NARE ribosyltransferase [Upupa epops]